MSNNKQNRYNSYCIGTKKEKGINMNNKTIVPSVLSVAIGSILIGCGGGGGGGNVATGPVVTQPPISGGNNLSKYDVAEPTARTLVKVGVMDTGVEKNDYTRDNLEKVYSYTNQSLSDITSATVNRQDVSSNKHGTTVAMIIAGKAINGSKQGIAKSVVDLYSVRTADAPTGISNARDNLQAMQLLNSRHGVKLFNASFGTPNANVSAAYKATLVSEAQKVANTGSLVVYASGNDKKTQPTAEGLLAVGNKTIEKGTLVVTGLNQRGTALYSDSGSGANACGDAARWCLAADYINGPYFRPGSNTLMDFKGTSGAAPQVTSAAALVWSKYPWMTADQIRQTILTTADYINDGTGNNALYNKTYGWGELNLASALKGPELFSKTLNDSTFNANVTSLSIFSNNIGGDAGLVKSGNATLVLSGNNSYQGKTTVNAGKLQVTGALNNSEVLVNSSGILSGKGVVRSVENKGRVSTFDGPLSIRGNYTQANNATLEYSLTNPLKVDGNATLAGNLDVRAESQSLVKKGKYEVLSAKNLNGNFTKVKSLNNFLKVSAVTPIGSQVIADIDHANAAAVGSIAGAISTHSGDLTNQILAQADLQSEQAEIPLVRYATNVLQVSNAASAQAVLNSNSGALFAETPAVILRNDSLNHLQVARRMFMVTNHNQSGIWLSGSYAENEHEASGWDQVKSQVTTFNAGADFKPNAKSLVGGFISKYDEESKFNLSAGENDVDLISFGIYGKYYLLDPVYISSSLSYGLGDTTFKRELFDGLNNVTEKSKTDIDKFGLYAELGREYKHNQWLISPYVAYSYNTVKLDDLYEQNAQGLSVANLRASENKAHLGLRAEFPILQNLTIGGFTDYSYAFDRSNPTVKISSNLVNGSLTQFQTPNYDKDIWMYGLYFNYEPQQTNLSIFGDIAGNAVNSGDVQAQLGVKYQF